MVTDSSTTVGVATQKAYTCKASAGCQQIDGSLIIGDTQKGTHPLLTRVGDKSCATHRQHSSIHTHLYAVAGPQFELALRTHSLHGTPWQWEAARTGGRVLGRRRRDLDRVRVGEHHRVGVGRREADAHGRVVARAQTVADLLGLDLPSEQFGRKVLPRGTRSTHSTSEAHVAV